MPAVLNVGGNSKKIPLPPIYAGWQHVLLDIDPRGQPDVVCDARTLGQLPAATYEAVYCSHNLEHYFHHEAQQVARGFVHVLKPEGFAHIRVPDMLELMRTVVERQLDMDDVLYRSGAGPIKVRDVIYGYGVEIERSGNPYFAHKTGFTQKSLTQLLHGCGFPMVFSRVGRLEVVAYAFTQKPHAALAKRLELERCSKSEATTRAAAPSTGVTGRAVTASRALLATKSAQRVSVPLKQVISVSAGQTVSGQFNPTFAGSDRVRRLLAADVTDQLKPTSASRERLNAIDALVVAGDYAAAETALAAFEAEMPPSIRSRRLKAVLLVQRQQWQEAETLLRELKRALPDDQFVLHEHATMLVNLQRFDEARQEFQAMLNRWPDLFLVRLNLGALFIASLHEPYNALEVLLPVVAQHPHEFRLHLNIGRARLDLLDIEGCLASYREALRLSPGNPRVLSALMFCSHYLPEIDLESLRATAERQAAQFLRKSIEPAAASIPQDHQQLRIGLLSGDWYEHPVSFFLESVLQALHQRGVELVAYDNGRTVDAFTQRLRTHVSTWRSVAALSDSELASCIAADRLHVLLDLSGYTKHGRVPVLLHRPAPLQISWLGYFGTLGVPEVDAIVADPHCVPPDEQRFYSERVLYMPHTRLCMTPPANAPEPAPEPPLAASGALRFACLQNAHKINSRVLAAWRQILDGAPQATLLLQPVRKDQGDTRQRFEAMLDASGIDRSRVLLSDRVSRSTYLKQYAQIDVLLDTFPYPGGTTTAEALWMGVPTLTLATPGMLGRQGQAFLNNVGLADWVTHSDEDYVARAIALARDTEGTLTTLRQLRHTLRDTARRSPLFDADTFASDFEHLLRQACVARAAA